MATYSLKGTDKQNLSHTLLNGHPFLASVKVLQQTKPPPPNPALLSAHPDVAWGTFHKD